MKKNFSVLLACCLAALASPLFADGVEPLRLRPNAPPKMERGSLALAKPPAAEPLEAVEVRDKPVDTERVSRALRRQFLHAAYPAAWGTPLWVAAQLGDETLVELLTNKSTKSDEETVSD